MELSSFAFPQNGYHATKPLLRPDGKSPQAEGVEVLSEFIQSITLSLALQTVVLVAFILPDEKLFLILPDPW